MCKAEKCIHHNLAANMSYILLLVNIKDDYVKDGVRFTGNIVAQH